MASRRCFQGNTIVEYALPAACIVCVCVMGLQVMGGNLNGVFAFLKKDMGKHSQSAQAAVAQHTASVAALSTSAPVSTATPTQICSTAGQCASLGSSMDLNVAVQTAGANGTIKVMGDKIRLIAAQLLASNQITPAQAGIFNDLANQGYRIGQISGLVEQTAKVCGSNAACFSGTSVSFEGKPYTMQSLSAMIGYKSLSATDQTQTANSPEVASLWSIFKNLPPTVFSNPALKDTVLTLTTQIGQTSNLVMWGASNISNGYMAPNGMQNYLVTQAQGTIPQSGLAQGQTAQASTGQASGTICTSGNGSTNGKVCK